VQVLSGTGHTYGTPDGEGDLVVGYDEEPGVQTGMNNHVVGFKQAFTSYASIVGGEANSSSGPNGDVFGVDDAVTEDGASVAGGAENTAGGDWPAQRGRGPPPSTCAASGPSAGGGDMVGGYLEFVTKVCQLCADFAHGLEGREWRGRTEA
jgi:hypothetical protein